MTKQEKIQEVYGKHFKICNPDENGWCKYPNTEKISEDWDIDFGEDYGNSPDEFYVRPKSLQEIETNNGWIKIESENDLPTIGEYYTIVKFDNMIVERHFPNSKVNLEFNKEWWLKYITHYQPIQKPQPPIY